LKQRNKKEAYIETRRDKHPVPERIKLVHNVIMSHAMHKEINQARLSQLSFEKLSISCCPVNSARMSNSNKVLLHQKMQNEKNVVQNFSGGCNACV
jgi:hypothetical protein